MAEIINPAYLGWPAQVQKNKDDIAELKASAWNPNVKGAYSDSVSYNYNDLVSYTDGNVYYHSSETQTQGVPPTNSETWTLYQIGIPGEQGEPGQQGEPGTPGADALFYTTIYNSTSDPTAPGTFNIPVLPFSRTPKQNDAFVLLSSYNNILYAGMAIIVNVGNPDATVQYQGVQRITGSQGEPGISALIDGAVESYPNIGNVGTNFVFSTNSFNRTPIDGESFTFIGIDTNTNKKYIGYASVNSFNVGGTGSAKVKSATLISGENGADGQGFNYMGAWVSENEYHEYDVVTYNGSSYVNILAISGSATPPASDATHWDIFAERGAQGDAGEVPQLYRHIIKFDQSAEVYGSTIIYSYRNSAYDKSALIAALTSFGCIDPSTYYPANGRYTISGTQTSIDGIFASGSSLMFQHENGSGRISNISDNVSPIE